MNNSLVFGGPLRHLMKPLYVMQMGRSKSWSLDAQIRALENLETACERTIGDIDAQLHRLGRR